jgi:hypothetical protein
LIVRTYSAPPDVVRAGLQLPIMFITRDAESMRLERPTSGGWPEADIWETLNTMRSVYGTFQGDAYFLQVFGMFHLDMTDAPCADDRYPRRPRVMTSNVRLLRWLGEGKGTSRSHGSARVDGVNASRVGRPCPRR